MKKRVAGLLGRIIVASAVLGLGVANAQTPAQTAGAVTPIQHLVVIFQENVSFDHYFGTYPYATNPIGEPAFWAYPTTPSVNGYTASTFNNNANATNATNGKGAAGPFRLDRSQAATSDQGHNYTPEQMAYHAGLADLFPSQVGTAGVGAGVVGTTGIVMGYYDGNTVTGLWNYAQHYAMNDNSYGTVYGPSTNGALSLVSGQTHGVTYNVNGTAGVVNDGYGGLTLINDADPSGDACSTTTGELVGMSGKNIGDLLNVAGVSWGFFEGGFNLGLTNSDGSTGCARSTTSLITNSKKADYIPHHQPFQYYQSTANPMHVRPTSTLTIGQAGDPANHQYDMSDFFTALSAGNLPAVSFLKAPGYQDGHAGYSDPLDEQTFVVNTINSLMQSPAWGSTAVVIAWDDSDGWYDHQMPPIVNQSATAADALTGTGLCGSGTTALPGVTAAVVHAQGRCGYGPRLPLLVVSPYAKQNFVDHTTTDQSSILRFVEDNWLNGARIPGSFDALAGSLDNMFNFETAPNMSTFLLSSSSGEPLNPTQSALPKVIVENPFIKKGVGPDKQ